MNIIRAAVAGSLESNDALVSVSPGDGALEINIESVVMNQFGEAIERAILDVCREAGVNNARLRVNDMGALECTLRARVETALTRAGRECEP